MKKIVALLLAVMLMSAMSVQAFAEQIFVKDYDGQDILEGKTITLEVNLSDPIAAIKAKILEKTGIAVKQQKLFFNGTELADDTKTLEYYGVQKENTLKLNIDLLNSPINGGSDGTYYIGISGAYTPGANAADVVSVDISWDAMNFTYSEGTLGTWSPENHSYSGGTEGGWSADKAGITVTNHSNVGVDATMSFTATASGVNGTFYTKGENNTYTAITSAADQKLDLANAVGTTKENAPAGTLYFGVSGDAISEDKTLGTITVTIAKEDTKIYTGEALAAALTTLGTTGGTITLGGDVTLPVDDETDLNMCIFGVENGKSLVLDLNGHTVTGILYAGNAQGDGSALFTVKNGNLQYTTTSEWGQEAGIITALKVNTQINDVTITASGLGAVVGIYSNVTIADATLNGGVQTSSGTTMTAAINNGTLTFTGKTILGGGVSRGNNGTIKAEAGTYNFDPTDIVDTENYTVTANANSTWTVSAKTFD